jgi:hypothetical protein
MDEAGGRASSYGIFVRFRKTKLALRRGITSLPLALEIAAQLRADRLHGQRDVFIIKHPEGTVVELPPPERVAAPSPAPQIALPALDPEPVHDGAANGARTRAPVEVVPAELARVPARARPDRMQRAIARARAARASFERTVPAPTPDGLGAELVEIQERLMVLHAATCRVAETFEAIVVLLEKRNAT